MKNLIKLSTLFIATSMLFASCESNLSLTKRHYTSGYYIDYTKNTSITPKSTDKVAQTPATNVTIVANSPAKQNTESKNAVSIIKPKIASVTTTAKSLLPKINLQPVIKPNAINGFITINSQPREANPILAESPTTTDRVMDRGDRALSLIWLVIVIILIIWLIGLIAGGFGLGGFINLLLLIALILLILWLLRVI